MFLDCLLNFLWLNADISLGGGGTAVLKESLHECYVKAVCILDFRCVPLAETVGADTLVPQIMADNVKLLLHCTLFFRKCQKTQMFGQIISAPTVGTQRLFDKHQFATLLSQADMHFIIFVQIRKTISWLHSVSVFQGCTAQFGKEAQRDFAPFPQTQLCGASLDFLGSTSSFSS